ncbi:MAG: phosphoribosylanthranilate isomerase [Hellea sp.]|nr:phosphoribosylanthranilate isomerase [Hellea sp.]
MTPEVKICGLTRAEDVEAAIAHGADYLGFIVKAKSSRRLSVAEAARLARPAKGIIPRVAVTVNEEAQTIARIMSDMQPDYIQFHGDESPEHIAEIAKTYRVKTIKALPIAAADDLLSAMAFSGFVDLLLFDARPPKGEAQRGGHGLSFDWDILKGAPLPKTWLLAGGLNSENVGNALATGAPILDVSSGVESVPGVKDHEKIETFIQCLH